MTARPSAAADRERQALFAIRKLKAQLREATQARSEPIAIVGMACRFPGGVSDPAGFWRLLLDEVDAVGEIPPQRLDLGGLFDADPQAPGKTYSRWAGLVDGVDQFDADFFGISPREAAQTDPQQRLFLECAWTALEHAGIAPNGLAGSATGVFAGVTTAEYARLHDQLVSREQISAYSAQGLALNAIAGRVAHILGLQGPVLAVDTACSSSLVGVHLACRSLRDGESDLALAGGVNVIAVAEGLVTASRWGMLSGSGRCRSFSGGADGFVRGEGCGVVVLKRLGDAVASGDRVLAVIRGSAVNHDGPSSGLTVPNGLAQQALIRRALERAGVGPELVGYVEAHGTGTALGDPIEAEALGAVFGPSRPAGRPLLIGSVKTNIGHLEAAAGVAGLIKVVLALGQAKVPAQLHCGEPSGHIRWAALRLAVADAARPWEPIGGRRIAGVSSFGFSGTNAHLVVEAAPEPPPPLPDPARPVEILSLSARSRTALHALARGYLARLAEGSDAADGRLWPELCHTAGVGRARFAHRCSVRGPDAAAGREGLEALLAGRPHPALVEAEAAPGARPRVAFMFAGQGAQQPGMGRALYRASPTFRRRIDAGEALLRDHGTLDAPLGAVIRGEHPDAPRLLAQTLYTQPALFLFGYALAELWREAGVEPAAVIGHSLGEYTAAAAAGVFGFEDALLLVADRARLMHDAPGDGAMLAVAATEAELAPLVAGHPGLSLAAVNGPRQVTLSGERHAVDAVAALCRDRGWNTSPLPVSQAFHSSLMDPVAGPFEARAAALAYATPRIPLVSNLSGAPLDTLDAPYWRRHLRQPVRFADGVRALHALGCTILLEIGPRPLLASLARASLPAGVRILPSLKGPASEWDAFAETLQTLDAAGLPIDWAGWNRGHPRRKRAAPTYPFERRRHWLAPAAPAQATPSTAPAATPSLLGARLRSARDGAQFEARILPAGPLAWLADHRIDGRILLPATAFIDMMLAAADTIDSQPLTLANLALHAALVLHPDHPRTVQTILDPTPDGATVRVFALDADPDGREHPDASRFRLHAQAQLLTRASNPAPEPNPEPVDLDALLARCPRRIDHDTHYRSLANRRAPFGPAFKGVHAIAAGDREALADIRPTPLTAQNNPTQSNPNRPHPALLDACLQTAAAILPDTQDTFLPVSLDAFLIHTLPWPQNLRVLAKLSNPNPNNPAFHISCLDTAGNTLASLSNLQFRKASPTTTAEQDLRNACYALRWRRGQSLTSGAPPNGRWVVVCDRRGVGRAIAEELNGAGARCDLVDPAAPEDADCRHWLAGGPDTRGVIDCRPVDADFDLDEPGEAALNNHAGLYGGALRLAQAAALLDAPPPVFFVTADAAPIEGRPGKPVRDLLSAFRKAVQAEHPHVVCRLIDLDPSLADLAPQVLQELAASDEPEVSFREGARWVPRLMPVAASEPAPTKMLRELTPAPSGLIEDIEIATRPRADPGPGELEIRAEATGLNFRDVLNALGMLPGAGHRIGGECAGVVVKSGAGTALGPGDPVIAFCPGQSGSYVTVPECHVVRKPESLSFAEAAALPVAYMTAIYALDRLAGVRPGQTVLVHAGAGGLGSAAIRLAVARGATVYATAGSEAKRQYARKLGAARAMDSRTPSFAPELHELTGGRGVDIVLNSLTGALLDESIALVAPGGTFLEAGKRGVLAPAEATRRRPDIQYHLFDLGEAAEAQPDLVPGLMREMISLLKAGLIAPLAVTSYPFAHAQAAFRTMAAARHRGKLVLVHTSEDDPQNRGRGTYLITGGFGALGLKAAAWAARRGAEGVILLGRGEKPAARDAIAALRAGGLKVFTEFADCADAPALTAIIDGLPTDLPLRGVVHCAGVLDDALLAGQTVDSFMTVARPKVAGAVALHQATAGVPLDCFVLFSSAAAALGSAGQANYAAANAFMGAVARDRATRGLKALAVEWGPWAGEGMADAAAARRHAAGLEPLQADAAFALLDRLIEGPHAQVCVAAARAGSTLPATGSAERTDPLFADIATPKAAGPAPEAILDTLNSAPPAGRKHVLTAYLQTAVARILGATEPENIAPAVPFQEKGIDSLMSVELRNALVKSLGLTLPPTVALDYPTLETLCAKLLADLFPPSPHGDEGLAAFTDIAALSEQEAEAMLVEELEALNV